MQKELEQNTSECTFIQIWFRNCSYTVSSNNHNLEFRDNQKLNDLYTNRYFILSLTSNVAEGSLMKMKRGVIREQLITNSPRFIWEYCFKRHSYMRPYTVLNILSLEGQVLGTHIFGNQADMPTVDEYYWYEWVRYHVTPVNFPDTNMKLCRDLGPVNIGPAMEQKIMKSNGEITYKIDVRSLTPEYLASLD
jgi:hypothetical protein